MPLMVERVGEGGGLLAIDEAALKFSFPRPPTLPVGIVLPDGAPVGRRAELRPAAGAVSLGCWISFMGERLKAFLNLPPKPFFFWASTAGVGVALPLTVARSS